MRANDVEASPRMGSGTSPLAEAAYSDGRGDSSVSVSPLPEISDNDHAEI